MGVARCRAFAACVSLVLFLFGVCAGASAEPAEPRREDRGDLIVLHLYGSYYDMGRQQAELLGPVAREVYDYHRERYDRMVAAAGTRMRIVDFGVGLLPLLGPLYEDSGFFDEMNGVADGLGVPRRDLLRAVMAASFGSTVFAATRSATVDGGALIGRNVDWYDNNGTLRPVLMHYHPDNGDFAYIMAGWPLIGAPAIGMNETGFALSFNFFVVDETFGMPPEMRDRRALQVARTVEEGLRVFTDVRKRSMPTFMVMADAEGDIAMIECTPSEYTIFRPEGDWFAHANHARTPEMIPFDRYRSEDSFRRRAAMEAAVRPHVGKLTPEVAARIIRDRSNSPYVNDDTVGNLDVLNAAVLHPASKTVWHSTTMEPLAPFGEMQPFSVGADVSSTAALPADPRLGTPEMEHEAALIAEARGGVHAFLRGDYGAAVKIWDGIAARGEPLLHPDRLAWGRGAARFMLEQDGEAGAVLATVDRDRAPFTVAAHSLALLGLIADVHGRRDDGVSSYRRAQVVLDGHPEYTDALTQRLRSFVRDGIEKPHARGDAESLPHLQRLPE